MNAFIYRLTYWLGLSHWDSDKIAPEVEQTFQNGNLPDGPVLDLGCGTGANVIYMARLGRHAIGIDFVPQAIQKARIKARQAGVSDRTQFITADVTHLHELKLPQCAFALDMGCFHGLNVDGQNKYVQGLAEVLMPGGQFLLYVLEPRKEAGISFGLSPERIKLVFSPCFDLVQTRPGDFWDRNSSWFWMKKR